MTAGLNIRTVKHHIKAQAELFPKSSTQNNWICKKFLPISCAKNNFVEKRNILPSRKIEEWTYYYYDQSKPRGTFRN